MLTLVWSEFGRRPQENASGGTDHGAAGCAFVMGTRAAGTMIGEWPGLASGLDALGNVRATADFRGLYSSLLEQWLGQEAAPIIPGASGLRAHAGGAVRHATHGSARCACRSAAAGGLRQRAGASRARLKGQTAGTSYMQVIEVEYHLLLSRGVVRAGPVSLEAIDRGMDPHDLRLSQLGSEQPACGARTDAGQAVGRRGASQTRSLQAVVLAPRTCPPRHARHAQGDPLRAPVGYPPSTL